MLLFSYSFIDHVKITKLNKSISFDFSLFFNRQTRFFSGQKSFDIFLMSYWN